MEKTEYPLGAYLKAQRKAKGLSLQEIYRETRISPEVLRNIEEGEYLPASTYLKGFIKIYAKALGLNEERVLKEFYKEEPEEGQTVTKDSPEKIPKILLRKEFVFGGLVLVLLGFFVFQNFKGGKPSEKETNYHLLGEQVPEDPIAEDQAIAEPANKTMEAQKIIQGSLESDITQGVYAKTLMIQSLEDIVMYFKVDGQETVTKPLDKNIWYIIKAQDKIYVRVDGKSYLNFVHEGLLQHVSSENNFERTF